MLPEAVLGGLADYSNRPAGSALNRARGELGPAGPGSGMKRQGPGSRWREGWRSAALVGEVFPRRRQELPGMANRASHLLGIDHGLIPVVAFEP